MKVNRSTLVVLLVMCIANGRTLAGDPGFVGVVYATQQTVVSSRVDASIRSLAGALGDKVSRGTVLALLDDEELQRELQARQAALVRASAEYRRSVAAARQAHERQARREQAHDFFSREQIENARQEAEIADSELSVADAALMEAKAKREIAAINLEQTSIRAPFDGAISAVYAHVGAVVQPGTPMFRLINNELRIRFAVPPEEASRVIVGTRLDIDLIRKNEIVEAVVDRTSMEIDSASRHIFMEAKLQGSSALHMYVGQLVNVRLAR